jgi:hypothetical protein
MALIRNGAERPAFVSGILRSIDIMARTIQVFSDEAVFDIDVPAGCNIVLHDEHVKLRLLQPGDPVQVALDAEAETPVAHSVHVLHPGLHFAISR